MRSVLLLSLLAGCLHDPEPEDLGLASIRPLMDGGADMGCGPDSPGVCVDGDLLTCCVCPHSLCGGRCYLSQPADGGCWWR